MQLLYNGLGVHPVTGNVYINTIKSFPVLRIQILGLWIFNNHAENPAAKYKLSNFPCRFFFAPANKTVNLKTLNHETLE